MDGDPGQQGHGPGPSGRRPPDKPLRFDGRPPPLEWRRYVKPGLWGLLALYTLLFVVLNRDPVTVHFLFFTADAGVFWLILYCLGLGIGLDEGLRWYRRRGPRRAADPPARPGEDGRRGDETR